MVDLRQDLGPLKLIGVEETEDKVGQGSYGKVIVVYYKGFK